jgi:23S rRNA (uracil1939-C5)-methyltransferase
VVFVRRGRSKAALIVEAPITLEIESLDLEANGVAHYDGKVVFVRGALPGETVRAQVVRRKPKFEVAQTVEILKASSARVVPRCPHFTVCGGCSMQHLDARTQVSIKQRVLEDALWHLGKVKPETMLPPMVGDPWGYRYRARLSVRDVTKKGTVLVGFHERANSYVADMKECHVLPKRVSDLLMPLRELVGSLTIRNRMPQIELALGDTVLALVFRVKEPPSESDIERLKAFEDLHNLEIWLQAKGPDTIELLRTDRHSELSYGLPEFGVRMPFKPTDFTQVNHQINASLVGKAVRALAPETSDTVLDLFCGLGNFTLPLATMSAKVIGIEGAASLVARARAAALANGQQDKTEFQTANLFEFTAERYAQLGQIDRILIDPAREGAIEVMRVLCMPEVPRPKRIVYVSCNPATLARDLGELVHQGGYVIRAAGVVNMFPHTSHVESMAVLEPSG